MRQLLKTFPFVEETENKLIALNKLLDKVTLTGKINALHVAYTLFEFTDRTSLSFNELKQELVDALLEENLHKVLSELESKSKIAIDILIRNLFERTADVGFLATDGVIIDFLTNNNVLDEHMYNRLVEYANKYTVYNEIVITDIDGNVKINMNKNNHIIKTTDSIIKDALVSDEYIEYYRKTDLFLKQDKTLVYAQKIEKNGNSIGVLCLCFKLEDELNRILKNLAKKDEIIAIADKSGDIGINTNNLNQFNIRHSNSEYQLTKRGEIYLSRKTSGYQEYTGIEEWYSYAIKIYSTENKIELDSDKKRPSTVRLLNNKLQSIINKADDLVEDLQDVIINGELIASKKKVYLLTPILDNLRDISHSLIDTIKSSVENLEKLVEISIINDTKMSAHLAIDIMDRNLYERANDCRWWAITPLFQEELSKDEPDTDALNETLLYINNLYTVYTNLYIYDKNGKIVASSNDLTIIGKNSSTMNLSKIMSNQDTQNYFVSDFEQSEFYEDRPTYIYNATISHNEKSVGGIGIVFDSEVEFNNILLDSFPLKKNGFSFLIDNNQKIISSTHPVLKPLDMLDIDEIYLKNSSIHATYDYIEFDSKNYVMGCAKSNGYREYKNEDNYTNDIYALTFLEL